MSSNVLSVRGAITREYHFNTVAMTLAAVWATSTAMAIVRATRSSLRHSSASGSADTPKTTPRITNSIGNVFLNVRTMLGATVWKRSRSMLRAMNAMVILAATAATTNPPNTTRPTNRWTTGSSNKESNGMTTLRGVIEQCTKATGRWGAGNVTRFSALTAFGHPSEAR